MNKSFVKLGIDLGGTKIEIAGLNTKDNKIIYRKRIYSPQNNYFNTLDAIKNLIDIAENELGFDCPVGIGIPGSVSNKTGKVRNANSVWLNNKFIVDDLCQKLNKKIKIENDANCFAISEAMDGAGSQYSNVFGVILGTGVGSGIVLNKKVMKGSNGISGEWGHNPLPWKGKLETNQRLCWCGKLDCIEKYISGPSVENEHKEIFNDELSMQQIAEKYTGEDKKCKVTIDLLINRIARCLASVINIIDPEAIILGGGLSNLDILYKEVPKVWKNWVFSDSVNTKLLKSLHGDSSGVRGAAWLN
jgi:fructokinase